MNTENLAYYIGEQSDMLRRVYQKHVEREAELKCMLDSLNGPDELNTSIESMFFGGRQHKDIRFIETLIKLENLRYKSELREYIDNAKCRIGEEVLSFDYNESSNVTDLDQLIEQLS